MHTKKQTFYQSLAVNEDVVDLLTEREKGE